MPKSDPVDFRQAWRTVGELAGEPLTDELGHSFQFVFKRTFVVISPGGASIPRTNFEKIFKNPAGASVQGARFIKAIYRHPAFAPRRD